MHDLRELSKIKSIKNWAQFEILVDSYYLINKMVNIALNVLKYEKDIEKSFRKNKKNMESFLEEQSDILIKSRVIAEQFQQNNKPYYYSSGRKMRENDEVGFAFSYYKGEASLIVYFKEEIDDYLNNHKSYMKTGLTIIMIRSKEFKTSLK